LAPSIETSKTSENLNSLSWGQALPSSTADSIWVSSQLHNFTMYYGLQIILFSSSCTVFTCYQSYDKLLIVYRTIAFLPAVYEQSKHFRGFSQVGILYGITKFTFRTY
jgi:hypothetical protein